MMVLDFHLFDSARILNLSDVQLQIIFTNLNILLESQKVDSFGIQQN